MASNAIPQYLKNVEKDLAGGRATEHIYRPALKAVVESFAKGITATNEPKRDSLAPLSDPNDEDAVAHDPITMPESQKKEVAPDGSKDENVFDIQQGVAIRIMVKNPQGKVKGKRP